nr:hypothetical protein [Thiocapsa sp. KS1]
MLVVYNLVEMYRVKQRGKDEWYISPALWCGLFTFILGYGLANPLYLLLPDDMLFGMGIVPGITDAMLWTVGYAFVGAVGLYFGYWAISSVRITRWFWVRSLKRRILKGPNAALTLNMVVVMFVLSVAARLMMVKVGQYGYSMDHSTFHESVGYIAYLSILGGAGRIALLLYAMERFRISPATRAKSAVLYGMLMIEVLLGVLAGFKSQVIMPFIIVGIGYFIARRRVPITFIVLGILAFPVAFAIVEPFREVRNTDAGFVSNDIGYLIGAVIEGQRRSPEEDAASTWGVFVLKSNLLYPSSLGVEYAKSDVRERLRPYEPEFLSHLLLSPVLAVVPRFVWPSKPMTPQVGGWARAFILGRDDGGGAFGIGPIAYLVLAGGGIAVFVAFLVIGFLQRIVFSITTPWMSMPGLVVFIFVAQNFLMIDSNVSGVIGNVFRGFALGLLAQYFLFRDSKVRKF